MPNVVEIGPVVLDKKMKMWKVYEHNEDDDDNEDADDAQQTNFVQKNSIEPLALDMGKLAKLEIASTPPAKNVLKCKFR